MAKKKRWFVSHASGGIANAPAFFNAIKVMQQGKHVELLVPETEPGKVQHRLEELKTADMVIAEVSTASTGSGIELGWAHALQKPIIAFHHGTSSISPAVPLVAAAIHAYLSAEDILAVIDSL